MEDVCSSNVAKDRESHFLDLYQIAFPVIAKYVSRMGGSFEEAKDVFQDAMIVYYEKNKIIPLLNDSAYLVGISKNLWLKRYRDNYQHTISLDKVQTDIMSEEDLMPVSKRLMRFLEVAGEKCMKLLKAFYYDQIPLTEIAGQFGFSGTRSATVQKYKCLEKVRETVKEKALEYDDFIE